MGTGRSKQQRPSEWSDTPIVTTTSGQVQGKRLTLVDERTVDMFMGIPFARPPERELRFRKPLPPLSWEGIRPCTDWAAPAIQRQYWFLCRRNRPTSEDCLYLNVFAPGAQSPEFPSGYPVMVYIHGGAFVVGDAPSQGDCRGLVAKEVVVVTIQYRLGYLGFWCSEDDSIPPNLGLWDQRAALQWVQENVAAFGGDKDNITVAGQSAGGISVDMLMLSPHSNTLFHRAIIMSGVARKGRVREKGEMAAICLEKAEKMGLKWTTSRDLHEGLLAVSPNKFIAQTPFQKGLGLTPECSPVLDGDFLPEDIDELRVKAPKIPLMIGVASLEALLFSIRKRPDEAAVERALIQCVPDSVEKAGEARAHLSSSYFAGKQFKGQLKLRRMELISDAYFNAPTLNVARWAAGRNEGQSPTFLYVWEHVNPKSWGWLRFFMKYTNASHCTELAYMFGKPVISSFKFNNDDKMMSDIFTDAITNFVKYGNPNDSVDGSEQPVMWRNMTGGEDERHLVFKLPVEEKECFLGGRPGRILALQKPTKIPKIDILMDTS